MTPRLALLSLLTLGACAVASVALRPDAGVLKRIATVPRGAEVTGLFLHEGDLFFNAQHPRRSLPTAFSRATVGVVAAADFDTPALAVAKGGDRDIVTTSLGRYTPLLREGDFGVIGAIDGAGGRIEISNKPDFNAFLPTGPGAGYLFTNWEARPGGMSRARLTRSADGAWQADPSSAMMVDFSEVAGTWVNCFGTLSPWNTPLSSEELYFDNTANWRNPVYRRLFGVTALANYLGHEPNPYRYGYIVEITDPAGTPTPVKRVALGRFSHENALVMPDRRTVYLSDDGTGTVFFKFVADRAGDLSAGTLYAAHARQTTPPGSSVQDSSFALDWLRLAHATEAEIAGWIADYDAAGPEAGFISDAEIAAWAAGRAPDDRVAFLESRKAAAAKGATAEFRKMEGLNMNPAAIAAGQRFAYMAMSEISKTMADGVGDIQLAENSCGAVFQLSLDAGYDIARMTPVLTGGPYLGGFIANGCAVDNIANPDNIVVRDDGAVIVGEDSGHHENNAIWLWQPAAM